MKKIFLAALMAISFAVSSGLFAAANAANFDGNGQPNSSIYTNETGSQG